MILFLIFISNLSYAGQGMVTVLEAPLFAKPDINSRVIQHYRKGTKIYIHPKYFISSPNEKDYENLDNFIANNEIDNEYLYSDNISKTSKINESLDELDFYITIDRKGAKAFVPKKFVKLIYRDDREFLEPLKKMDTDPTDYRLNEPLPKGYPFIDKVYYRSLAVAGFGTQSKSNYNYSGNLFGENYGTKLNLQFSYERSILENRDGRMFFGAMGIISSWTNEFELQYPTFNGKSQELYLRLGVGPLISFDVLRKNKINLVSYFALPFYFFNQISVDQTSYGSNSQQDARKYKKLAILPNLGFYFFRGDILEETTLVVGVNMEYSPKLRYELSSSQNAAAFWQTGNADVVEQKSGAQANFYIGIVSHI